MQGRPFLSCAGLLLLLGMAGASATSPSVPDSISQAKAEKLIKSVYKAEYARVDAADRQALARKLLHQGMATRNDPAAQYVLIREARDLAAGAGDARTAMRAVDVLAGHSASEIAGMRIALLTQAFRAAATPQALEAVVEETLSAVTAALGGEEFDAAGRLCDLAGLAAARCRNPALAAQAQVRAREVVVLAEMHRKAEEAARILACNPEDRPSQALVGRYRCLAKGDWAGGLPLLAHGDDAALAAVAARDLVGPVVADSQAELAGKWWELSEPADEPARRQLQDRAAYWYRRALDGLGGLSRTLAEQRLAQTEARWLEDQRLDPGLWTELFKGESFEQQVKTRVDLRVDFDWGLAAPDPALPKDCFSIRWSGKLLVRQAGFYTFTVIANAGARLLLDEQVLIDAPRLSRKRSGEHATVKLAAGLHPLQLDYWDDTGTARVKLRWMTPGKSQVETVPPDALYHLKQ